MALDLFLVRIRGVLGCIYRLVRCFRTIGYTLEPILAFKACLGEEVKCRNHLGPKKTAQNSSRASKHEQFSFLIFRETLTGHNLVIRTPIFENSDSISRIFPRRTQWHSPFPLIQIL